MVFIWFDSDLIGIVCISAVDRILKGETISVQQPTPISNAESKVAGFIDIVDYSIKKLGKALIFMDINDAFDGFGLSILASFFASLQGWW